MNRRHRHGGLASVMLLGAGLAAAAATAPPRFTGLWEVEALSQTPAHEWGATRDGVREVWFTSAVYLNQPTRVFAYLGVPEAGSGPFPGLVLLHGYGQNADPQWVRYWMDRGYAAIAVDLDARDPNGPLPDGGPALRTVNIFGPFPWSNPRNGWSYHAVARAMLAHSLLAAQPGVDPERIGVTGMSWGGFATCLVAGVDARLRAAAALYGCGFLMENSFWLQYVTPLDCRRLEEYRTLLDPGAFLPGVTCPMLFQVGADDPFFPPDSQRHSWEVCGGDKRTAYRPAFVHGEFWRWPDGRGETEWFFDHELKGGPAPPRVRLLEESEETLTCAVVPAGAVTGVFLNTTTDVGAWSVRHWTQNPLQVAADDLGRFGVRLPPERPLAAFVSVQATAPGGGTTWFSSPFVFRYGADSPTAVIFDDASLTPDGLHVAGRKPRGQFIRIEATTDWCRWTPLLTNRTAGVEFEADLPSIPLRGDQGWRVLRARRWELVR